MKVYLWGRDTEHADVADLEAADAVLSVSERARRDRFGFIEDRRDYALAHALLRTSIATLVDAAPEALEFENDRYGRSRLRDTDELRRARPSGARLADLAFTLSHTRGFVACAITWRAALGVDVERIDPTVNVEKIARWHFSPPEVAALNNVSS